MLLSARPPPTAADRLALLHPSVHLLPSGISEMFLLLLIRYRRSCLQDDSRPLWVGKNPTNLTALFFCFVVKLQVKLATLPQPNEGKSQDAELILNFF